MRRWPLIFALYSAILLPSGARAESPQILALVETPGPIAMICDESACQVELTAFCLQEHRPAPGHGTAYRASRPDAFSLVLQTADGAETRLPATEHLSISSVRGYSAVTAVLSRADLQALGAATPSVVVGQNVSLLPASSPDASGGDGNAAPDVAAATGPMREIGRRVVDQGGETMVAIRATNALINAMPRAAFTARHSTTDLWRTAVAVPMAGADDAGLERAAAAFDHCTKLMRYLGNETVRLCLQLHHDNMVETLTQEYWRQVGAGS